MPPCVHRAGHGGPLLSGAAGWTRLPALDRSEHTFVESYVKSEVDHISVLNNVFLAFKAKLPLFLAGAQ